ncbi:RlmE family RNA methyltransferase [Stappia stellulata]|uniref:RlmE family RNA methyltransferase n=1 Tax=Stappia stellulata TaxID=71235 RepID=UPI0003FE1F30|nr:RlmE family RNA methyltransferase [Stappia stellulata]
MSGSGRGRGDRGMFERVKTAKRRTNSSARWLQRQLNDPYVRAAKIDGYRSRAAYKILEIDDRHHILKTGQRIVDLGAAPGGWCQVAAAKTGSTDQDPRIVGIDYLEVEPLPGVTLLLKDFLDDDAPEALRAALGGHAPNLVMSDMAAPTTGHRQTDHLRTTHLFEVAEEFARENLAPGGAFLSKVFRGGAENEALVRLKRDYQSVHHIKPPASRKESPELYVLAKGFRGSGD